MTEVYGLTDIGLVRDMNQDGFLISENASGDILVLVCDGVGGSRAGEVASGEVIRYFHDIFPKAPAFEDLIVAREYLTHHIRQINKTVYDLSMEYPEFRGMGTTLTGFLKTSMGTLSINVGDSRVYGFLDGKSFRLTIDHTLINEMLLSGQITYEESINHPKKHYLVRWIGVGDGLQVDVHKVKDMEYYLACSDGLHGYVSNEEIVSIVYEEGLSVQ